MAYWYSTPSQTLTVWEEPPEKVSPVLNQWGEPYIITDKRKMGFDLTPKKDQKCLRNLKGSE